MGLTLTFLISLPATLNQLTGGGGSSSVVECFDFGQVLHHISDTAGSGLCWPQARLCTLASNVPQLTLHEMVRPSSHVQASYVWS